MKCTSVRVAAGLLLLAAACASPTAPVDTSFDASRLGIVAQLLQSDVAWLASDAREGRRAGTRGADVSADWIGARFGALGLEPAGEGGYFQTFEVPLPPEDRGASKVFGSSIEVEGKQNVVPLTSSAFGAAGGPLVFHGFGISQGEWDDYPVEAEGAIVLIVRGAPSAPPPAGAGDDSHNVERSTSWEPASSLFHKVMTAKRHGARAVLVAQHPRDGGKPLAEFETGREIRAGIPALMISAQVAEQLMPGYSVAVHAAGNASIAEPVRLSDIELFADVERGNAATRNVLARMPGRGGKTVVVGAHYDHLGFGGAGSLAHAHGPAIHNGADDNASGTAVVLELARRISVGTPPAGDVVFALWSGEELGLLGSEYWMQHPTLALEGISANLNLDMVGRAGNGKLQVLGAGTADAFAGWMEAAGRSAGLELDVSLSGTGLGGSDHQVFLRKEIPALHLFSGLHDDYHTPTDDTEGFEAFGAARVADLSRELIQRMGEARTLPFVAVYEKAQEGRRRTKLSVRFGARPAYGDEGPGLLLAGASGGSPADRAGLMDGDRILQVGDIEIDDIHAFMYALEIYKPGDVVRTKFMRGDELQEVRVTLEAQGGGGE